MDIIVWASWFLMGGICAYQAKQRGRNPLAWFAIGLLFGILGLILLFLLKPLNAAYLKRPMIIISKTGSPFSFKKAAEPANQSVTGEIPFLPVIAPELQHLTKEHKMWYYLDEENKRFGPMSFHALHGAWQEGAVTRTTYVWNEDFDGWKFFGELFQKPQTS